MKTALIGQNSDALKPFLQQHDITLCETEKALK